jgi:hypothetical protein
MAGMDYLSCESCYSRLIYMGERWEDYPDLKAHCPKCYQKLEKKIAKLEHRVRHRK